MPAIDTPLLRSFLEGAIDNREFHHADHVQVGFDLLQRVSFPEAAATYCAMLQAIAARAGRPEAFHMTITLAFLSLISERCAQSDFGDFSAFAHANPDLMTKSALGKWYAPERLQSEIARKTFVLPERP